MTVKQLFDRLKPYSESEFAECEVEVWQDDYGFSNVRLIELTEYCCAGEESDAANED